MELNNEETETIPVFLQNIQPGKIVELDVRPVIEGGNDPLSIILQAVKKLEPGKVLKIINSFKPTPLIHLLGKQGFESYVEQLSDKLIHTYFYKQSAESAVIAEPTVPVEMDEWNETLNRFCNRLVTIDVRELPIPLPMHTILEALDNLKEDHALFVFHKKIPVFLLPELNERKFSFRLKEISDTEVQMLIYKD